MYKIITLLLAIFIANPILAEANSKPVEHYVDELVAKASALLNNNQLSDEQKVTQSRALMADNLDLEWMAQYSLGHHKKGNKLSKEEIKEFTKTYSSYVIKTYSDLVRNYKGEKAVIKKVEPLDKNEYIVKTEVVQNSNSTIKVDYLVRDVGTAKDKPAVLKISDIITEGVSMINSQRSEFNSVISHEGIAGLIAQLKKKI